MTGYIPWLTPAQEGQIQPMVQSHEHIYKYWHIHPGWTAGKIL